MASKPLPRSTSTLALRGARRQPLLDLEEDPIGNVFSGADRTLVALAADVERVEGERVAHRVEDTRPAALQFAHGGGELDALCRGVIEVTSRLKRSRASTSSLRQLGLARKQEVWAGPSAPVTLMTAVKPVERSALASNATSGFGGGVARKGEAAGLDREPFVEKSRGSRGGS